MNRFLKNYIDTFEDYLSHTDEKAELLLIGGLAMATYGLPRHTGDIDAEIRCTDRTYDSLTAHLKSKGLAFNISEDVSRWGMVPLPDGYRKRATALYKGKHLILRVLDPVDFIFSKLTRGTELDFSDAVEVIKKYRITSGDIKKREELVKYLKDPETLFFKKKLQHLFELMKGIS